MFYYLLLFFVRCKVRHEFQVGNSERTVRDRKGSNHQLVDILILDCEFSIGFH